MKSLVSILFLFLLAMPTWSQGELNDCAYAAVVCDNGHLSFNPIGPGEDDYADPDNEPGCITALEQNSAWYYFQIDPNAPPNLVLGFIIHPNGGFGEDYDWALYGPNVPCGDLGFPIRCSSSSAQCGFCPETGMGMGTTDFSEGPGTGDGFVSTLIVQPGQGFYLMIDNWQGTMNGFDLEWTDTAQDWLNCDASPPCALEARAGADLDACEGDEDIQLIGESSGGFGNQTYSWSGTNGGTAFLSDPETQNPTVTLPLGFSGTIIYTLTVMEDTCVGVDDVELTVYPLPILAINPIGPFCANNPAETLTAVPGGGQWGGAATGNNFNPIINGPGIHEVTYSYTDFHGCSSETSAEIEVYELPEATIDPFPAVFCDNEAPVVLTVTGSGGAGGYTYQWTTPEVLDGNTIQASISGVYTIVVTDENACTNSSTSNVVFNANPTVQITDPGPICGNLQTFTLSATPPGGAYSGSFVSPGGNLTPVNIPPGSFQVAYSYEDANGCEATDYQMITVVTAPTVDALNNGPLCEGQPVLLFGSSDTISAAVTFSWTGPNGFVSNVQNPTNATVGGIYTFQAILNGCSSQIDTTVLNLSPRPDASAQNGGPYCGAQNFQLFGNTTATDPSTLFIWTGPNGFTSNLQNPSGALEPGLYSFVVDINGCQSLVSNTTLVINPQPLPVISGNQVFCTGFSSTLDAGAGYASYEWTGGSSNQTLDVTTSGTYQVTVTASSGCTGVASMNVTEQPSLSPSIIGTLEFCEGSGTVLDAGSGYVSYLWSTNETSQTINVTDGNNYAVIVTDADGCSGSTNVNTVEHPFPNVVIGGSTTYCIGGFTTLDAGNGYTSYAWSDNSTNQTLVVNTPGVYSVDVIDIYGCAGSAATTITESTSLSPVITGIPAFCENGSTTLNAGSGFASYIWSDGSTTQEVFIDVVGGISVTVSDGQGCFGDDTVNVIEVLPPVVQLQPSISLCNTEAGGSLLNLFDLIISGDVAGTWEDADQSGAVGLFNNLNFKGVAPGDYTFFYTTNSAVAPCPETTWETTVTVIDCVCPDVFFLNANPLCNGGDILDLATIENTTEIGTWSLIQTPAGSNPGTLVISVFNSTDGDPGEYIFQFTLQDQQPPGCPSDFQVSVMVDAAANAGVAGAPIGFCEHTDELIDLDSLITGEDANGTWIETSPVLSQGNAFDPNNATFAIKDQQPGSYSFQYSVSSNGVCPDGSTQVLVGIDAGPIVVIADPVELDCNITEQVLDATGSTPSGFEINFVWKGPGLLLDGSEHSYMPRINKPGTYSLSIWDVLSGCLTQDSVIVFANSDLPTSALIESHGPECFGDANGSIQVDDIIGGEGPFTFSLNNAPFVNGSSFNNLPAGDHTIEVSDANGCRWDTLISFPEPDLISIDLGPDIEISLGEDAEVSAIVNLLPGEIDTLIWTPEDIVSCFDIKCLDGTVTTFNTVTLEATLIALSGCEVSDQIVIRVNKNRKLYIPKVFSPNDDGVNDIFFISGNLKQIKMIRKFEIFNRWGDLVHQAFNFFPNDDSYGWDGQYKNVVQNPGVFAYVVKVEYVDGEVEVLTGDITLIR